MPDTKSAGETPEPTGSSGSKKKKIVTAVVAVVLVGVGYVLGGKLGAGAPAAADDSGAVATAEAPEEVEADEAHVGLVVDLDAVDVNLADGHYLRVAIPLGLAEDVVLEGAHGESAGFPVAAASDVVLHTFSGRTMSELSTTEGREAARNEVFEGLAPHYGDDIVSIYYTEFVMQ